MCFGHATFLNKKMIKETVEPEDIIEEDDIDLEEEESSWIGPGMFCSSGWFK